VSSIADLSLQEMIDAHDRIEQLTAGECKNYLARWIRENTANTAYILIILDYEDQFGINGLRGLVLNCLLELPDFYHDMKSVGDKWARPRSLDLWESINE
jgi:hypothetical protein